MSTEKIKKELVWIRQFIHKKDDENVVIRDANGKDIARWIDRVDAAIATPPAAERNKVASWMMAQGYATGHGDTTEDLLKELEWQVRESERESCAKVCEKQDGEHDYIYAAAIRARGQS